VATITLKSGITIACLSRFEARVVEEETEAYFSAGLLLPRNSTVLDVGAHVGIFSLGALANQRESRIYAFEPAPRSFDLLRENVARLGESRIEAINIGLSDQERSATLHYFPRCPALSTLHPEIWGNNVELLSELIRGKTRSVSRDQAWRHLPDCLSGVAAHWVHRKAELERVNLKTISGFVAERSLQKIDLLKVDCEGHETEVLCGISSTDWPVIHRVLVEVHDIDDRLARVKTMLESRGFRKVRSVQSEAFKTTNIHLTFASRR